MNRKVTLLGGVGPNSDLSAALMKTLSENYTVVGLTRSREAIRAIESRVEKRENVKLLQVDLLDAAAVAALVDEIEATTGEIAVYIHLAGMITLKSFLETTDMEITNNINVNFFSATAISRAVLEKMSQRNRGTLIFSGATASIRGGAHSAAFSAGKFALRGFAQSLAREFGPQGIHVAHVVIDGMIEGLRAQNQFHATWEQCIEAAAISRLYLDLIDQPKSMWTHELDIRPWNEKF
ncbi:MAG: SDR family NAD(P)-dependent oxidoreductase [Rhodocyclales bacterium]|nr:SDR family NAD(P)-dependent oxidoreductase [Rhodocyclales bacterium]